MDESGISITGLTVGGAALTAIGGIIGAWINAKNDRRRIEPQPLDIRHLPSAADKADNEDDHRYFRARLDEHGQEIAALKEQGRHNTKTLETMDRKLDRLLEKREAHG